MNDPYTPPGLTLTFNDRLAWRRYEKANDNAKKHYHALRLYIDGLNECAICGGRTYAPDGIHSLCKRNQETK